jgi:hypothetical protein
LTEDLEHNEALNVLLSLRERDAVLELVSVAEGFTGDRSF